MDSDNENRPVKKTCRETDRVVDTEPRLSYDKLYKEDKEHPDFTSDSDNGGSKKRTKARKTKKSQVESSEKETTTACKESESEVDAPVRQSTRTKTRKNAEAKKEQLRPACSESESECDRPVRQSTRTKTRKTKATVEASESEFSGSVSSDKEHVESEISQSEEKKEDVMEVSEEVHMTEEDHGDHDRDSGIMSAQSSEININISAKPMEAEIIEEEKQPTRSTRTKTRKVQKSESSDCEEVFVAPESPAPKTR